MNYTITTDAPNFPLITLADEVSAKSLVEWLTSTYYAKASCSPAKAKVFGDTYTMAPTKGNFPLLKLTNQDDAEAVATWAYDEWYVSSYVYRTDWLPTFDSNGILQYS